MAHVLVVSSRFYSDISNALEQGASAQLAAAGATFDVVDVPGALEIAAAIRFAIQSGKYDGFVALGCVIRGETSHYDIVSQESARALTVLTLQLNAAIGNGILTVENEEQAHVRANPTQGNKGGDAATACLRLVELKQQFGVRK